MAEFDFFELTGLAFDPPDKMARPVLAAITKLEKDIEGLLGNAAGDMERETLNKKKEFLKAVKAEILTPDGKRLTEEYAKMAQKRIEAVKADQKSVADALRLSGISTIARGAIRTQKSKTKLSEANVEAVYLAAGFTIIEVDPLAALPTFPPNAETIYGELNVLRNLKDPNPNGADLSLVTDMYAFTAYLIGEPENAAAYRAKTCEELVRIHDKFASQLSTRTDRIGKLCASLASHGKINIFSSDATRQAYELFLLYKSPGMAELFTTLKKVTRANLFDARFADACIKRIAEVFGDADMALALYNSEAGLRDEPYQPEKQLAFLVKCGHCLTLSEFVDSAESHRKNACQNCGKPLYKECPGCGKHMPAAADRCPECSFSLAGMAMFGKHMALAEDAVNRGEFAEARRHLVEAQAVAPSEKGKTAALARRIADEEEKYEKPLAQLRQVVAEGRIMAALEEISRIKKAFPKLNVSDTEKQAGAILMNARASLERARNFSPADRAEVCMNILDSCKDFLPALDMLRSIPLEEPKNALASVDRVNSAITISWSRLAQRGITYRVVRKRGRTAPANELDGEVLQDGFTSAALVDEGVEPGTFTSYSVFAHRAGVYSRPASATAVLLAEVSGVSSEQHETSVSIGWNAPKNCTGVTVKRTHGGKETVLAHSAQVRWCDDAVEFGQTYTYTLCANYAGMPSTEGVRVTVTPMAKIDGFSILAERVRGNVYKVSWNIQRAGIPVRIMMGKAVLREAISEAGSCEIEFSADAFFTVDAAAYSGGNWLASSNSVQINTFLPPEIDKEKSKVRENAGQGHGSATRSVDITLALSGEIPSNAVAFLFAARTKAVQSMPAPWLAAEDVADATDFRRISAAQVKSSKELSYTRAAADEDCYYITVFTVYSVFGKEVLSAPYTRRFQRPLTADVFWKVAKPLIGSRKLSIEIRANRPFLRMPKMVLCACGPNQHLLSPNDAAAVALMEVPEEEFQRPMTTFERDFDMSSSAFSRVKKGDKLFLFGLAPTPNEAYTMRWAQGFSGKA